jgi:hypothetical protein
MGIAGAAVSLMGVVVTGWFTYRGTRTAAAINARPTAEQNQFTVLQATVNRVDRENTELRTRQSRLESLVRACTWTMDRWARQMYDNGIEPAPPHPLVEEHNRTGV